MSQLKIYTDEDVHVAVAPQLRRRAIDAISAEEAARRGLSDDDQLSWSTLQGRCILTFNTAHFSTLHAIVLSRGEHHAGIVVSPQFSIGEVVTRIVRLMAALSGEQMHDRIEYLSNW